LEPRRFAATPRGTVQVGCRPGDRRHDDLGDVQCRRHRPVVQLADLTRPPYTAAAPSPAAACIAAHEGAP
jgi:hypothetical protein